MEPISSKYRDYIVQVMSLVHENPHITEHNVLQLARPELLPYLDKVVSDNLLPGSELRHPERLDELAAASERGESCLLLLEHYSNMDLPAFHYLVRKASPSGAAVTDRLVAIAGLKLNDDNPIVSALTEAYSRLFVYPSRSIEIIKTNIKDPKEALAEMMRSRAVNHASMKTLNEIKTEGRIILVFPTGTRFRPWDPSTKRGVREIDSYLKSFDKMCLVSINGNILRINPNGNMADDLVCQDRVICDVGPVTDCAQFREEVKADLRFRDDRKQAIVDAVMTQLETMHNEVEKTRL